MPASESVKGENLMTKAEFSSLYDRLYREALKEYNDSGRMKAELSKNANADGSISNNAASAVILTESVYLSGLFMKKVLESVLTFES